jgi:hypothetical protein
VGSLDWWKLILYKHNASSISSIYSLLVYLFPITSSSSSSLTSVSLSIMKLPSFFSLFSLLWVAAAQVGDEIWEDSEILSTMWSACSRRDSGAIANILKEDQSLAFARAADGRGALWWAYEFGHKDAIMMLESLGASPLSEDASGQTPKQLGIDNAALNAQRDIAFAAEEEEDDYDEVDLSGVPAFGDDHFGDEDEDEYAENDL